MRLIIAGPGRAGASVGIASELSGHQIVGVLTHNTPSDRWPNLRWGERLPDTDLLLIAVRDESIEAVAQRLVDMVDEVAVVAHMSGFFPVTILRGIQGKGVAIGGFHPLQSLPDPETGAASLNGAFAGIDGDDLAIDTLTHLATTLGMETFRLDDSTRPAYHAASAAAANFVVASLALSADLYESAGIDPKVSRPLVERAIANVYEHGPEGSLTGPIARGDIETVVGHLAAAKEVSDHVGRQFALMAEATTIRAGREEDLQRWK